MFILAVDLGQVHDPNASIILDVQDTGEARSYDVRYIEQFTLGTSYPDIIREVGTLMGRAPLARQCQLVIDHTGVGRPVFDLFTEAGLRPVGITITGGASWHREQWNQWHVAKILLVGSVQKNLQSGRLRIGATLAHATTLQKELRDFRVRVSKSANEIYEAREGQHDDLVLSLAIALFAAEHPVQRFLPVGT